MTTIETVGLSRLRETYQVGLEADCHSRGRSALCALRDASRRNVVVILSWLRIQDTPAALTDLVSRGTTFLVDNVRTTKLIFGVIFGIAGISAAITSISCLIAIAAAL